MSADPFRRTIATVCLSGTLEDKLTAAASAGFDGAEVFEPEDSAGGYLHVATLVHRGSAGVIAQVSAPPGRLSRVQPTTARDDSDADSR